jgi:hypothetical protein
MRHFKVDSDGNGTLDTEIIIEKHSWSINERVNARGTLDATVIDDNGVALEYGIEIGLYEDSMLLWGGVIIDVPSSKEVEKGKLRHTIKCEDYAALLDRYVIKGAYDNYTLEDIVNDLIINYFSNSGITAGTISANIEVSVIIINYFKGSEALDHLKSFGNIICWVDKDKQLHFVDLSGSGRIINSTSLTNEYGLERQRSGANYYNKLYLKGNKKITVEQSEKVLSPACDGETLEFFTQFSIAKDPFIEYKPAAGDWTEATIGVKGLHEGKQFYWSYGSTQITQDGDVLAALVAGSYIRATYYGLIPLFVVVANQAEITNRGFTHENYMENTKLFDTVDALQYGVQLLNKYAEDADKFQFKLYQKDYNVGELFQLTKGSPWDYDEQVLVESCTWTDMGIDGIQYQYNVLDGAAVGGWEEFFKNLLKPDRIEVEETEVLIYLKDISETIDQDGDYSFTLLDPLFPSTLLYPNTSLYPGTVNDTDSVSD